MFKNVCVQTRHKNAARIPLIRDIRAVSMARKTTVTPVASEQVRAGVGQLSQIARRQCFLCHNLLFFVIQYEKLSFPYLIVAPLAAERLVPVLPVAPLAAERHVPVLQVAPLAAERERKGGRHPCAVALGAALPAFVYLFPVHRCRG